MFILPSMWLKEAWVSETTGRTVVTVHASNKEAFEKKMEDSGVYCKEIGYVKLDDKFEIMYKGEQAVKTDVNELRAQNKGKIIL